MISQVENNRFKLLFLLGVVSLIVILSNSSDFLLLATESSYYGPALDIDYEKQENVFWTNTNTTNTTIIDYNGELPVIWTCSSKEKDPSRKLIFVHVFKTAGTTLRELFFGYGKKCGHAVTEIIECSDVSRKSLYTAAQNQDEYWRDRKSNKPCTNWHTTTARNRVVIKNKKLRASDLQKYNVDILAGHVAIGVDEFWYSEKSRIKAQYVTFVRGPLIRLVSGKLFTNRDKRWRENDALENIREYIIRAFKRGEYHNIYSTYWLTPLEKEGNLNETERVSRIKENLLSINPVLGVVENMGESLSLIQSVIDPGLELTDDFLQLDLSQHGRKKKITANKSKLSSSRLTMLLSQDKEWLEKATEVLKYEHEVYEYAVEFHKRQVLAMKRQYGTKFTHQ